MSGESPDIAASPKPPSNVPIQPSSVIEADGPVLVFGGCYSNLEATRALRGCATRLGIPPRSIICTGDVVAYCADPADTVALIREWDIHVVMGNCEESLGWGREGCGCGFAEGTLCDRLSAGWYAYANRVLGEDERAWMRSLPRRIDVRVGGRRLAAVHATVTDINRFVFASTRWPEKARQIALAECDGVIAGHCGVPFTQAVDGKLWHNAGAIGMPANDGTQRVWWSLLIPNSSGVVVRTMPLRYDARTAALRMRAVGLAEGYAAALETGLWPSCDVLPVEDLARRGMAITPGSLVWNEEIGFWPELD